MKVVYSHKPQEINDLIQSSFTEKSIIFSYKSTSYVNISDYEEAHYTEKSKEKTTQTTLNGCI